MVSGRMITLGEWSQLSGKKRIFAQRFKMSRYVYYITYHNQQSQGNSSGTEGQRRSRTVEDLSRCGSSARGFW